MGRLFGTDGIRGVAGEAPLDGPTVYRAGYHLARILAAASPAPRIVIGRDTRESGPWLEAVLTAAIQDAGGSALCTGVISTPAVSYLTRQMRADAGIMISASHNPYRDNGIKVFSADGTKLSDAAELDLEQGILSGSPAPPCPEVPSRPDHGSWLVPGPEPVDAYAAFLRACLPDRFSLEGMHLVVDCGNGSLSDIAPSFLHAMGARVDAIYCRPDGRNINLDCGALHPERLRSEVLSRGADLGVAFDGDADRAMFVDRLGATRDGDDMLYALARYGDSSDGAKIVVGTVMANLGLEAALSDIGFELVRTPVGDRYVLEEMVRLGAGLGGEQSGHIILARHAQTGDGLLTALKILQIIREQGSPLDELSRPVRRFPQKLFNVRVRERIPLERIPGLREKEAACRKKLGERSRILVRYSGTELLARIMVEAEDESAVRDAAGELAAFFAERLS